MEYTGRLFAKIGNKYVPIAHSDDFDKMAKDLEHFKQSYLNEVAKNSPLIEDKWRLLNAALKIKSEIDTDGLIQSSWEQMLLAIDKATK